MIRRKGRRRRDFSRLQIGSAVFFSDGPLTLLSLRTATRNGEPAVARVYGNSQHRERSMSRAQKLAGLHPSCLFPGEPEIAKLILEPSRAKAWPSLPIVLERRGLPKVDPQFGGRYWPKVCAFLHRLQHLDVEMRIPVEHRAPAPGTRTGSAQPRRQEPL